MDSEQSLPRKALFQKQRGLTSKHSQTLNDSNGNGKVLIKFSRKNGNCLTRMPILLNIVHNLSDFHPFSY